MARAVTENSNSGLVIVLSAVETHKVHPEIDGGSANIV